MKALKIFLISVLTAVVIATAATADINSIEQIEQTALLNNLEYKTAVLDLLKAENNLEGIIRLEGSSLSISGSYSGQDGMNPGYQASLSLPLFEQLSLDASVDQDLSTSVSLNLSPLSHSADSGMSKLDYGLKLAQAEATARTVADTAVRSYLNWSSASASYEIRLQTADVKRSLYDDEKIRFEMGESDLDDVRDAFTAWSDSRTALNTAFNELQAAETELYSTLNIDQSDADITPPAEADIVALAGALQEEIDRSELAVTGRIKILQAENAVETLELQRRNTWLFEPKLNISGNLVVTPEEPQPQLSATAIFSFSPDDWKASDINEIETELEISRQQAVQAVSAETLALKQAATNAETAEINYEITKVELEQAEELLNEARFLRQQGEYSEAELEESMLQYKQSKNNLFTAAADYYNALRALAAYSM